MSKETVLGERKDVLIREVSSFQGYRGVLRDGFPLYTAYKVLYTVSVKGLCCSII